MCYLLSRARSRGQITLKSERGERLVWWKAKQSEECLLWTDRERDKASPSATLKSCSAATRAVLGI